MLTAETPQRSPELQSLREQADAVTWLFAVNQPGQIGWEECSRRLAEIRREEDRLRRMATEAA